MHVLTYWACSTYNLTTNDYSLLYIYPQQLQKCENCVHVYIAWALDAVIFRAQPPRPKLYMYTMCVCPVYMKFHISICNCILYRGQSRKYIVHMQDTDKKVHFLPCSV